MLPTAGEVAIVLVGLPLLLALPGYLLLLGILPRSFGHLGRATVGAAATATLLPLLVWALHGAGGRALDAQLVWTSYALLLAASAAAAFAASGAWRPLPRPRLERAHGGLALITLLGMALAYRPRLGYGLPIHVDEWWHLAASAAMDAQSSVAFTSLLFGTPVASNPAVTYHILLVCLKTLGGVGWLALFHALPLVIVALTVLAAYAATQRHGYGLEAALLVALVPTSVRVLGPQYVVPLALGLFFIPASFMLFTAGRPLRALPLLSLMVVFLFYAHPQSAAAAGILIGTYGLLTLRRSFLQSLALLALAALPFVMGLLVLEQHVHVDRLLSASSRLPVPEFLLLFGLLPSLLFLGGAYLTSLEGEPERVAWLFTSFVHLLLVTLFVVWGIGQPNLYDRAWMHGLLTMSITGGYGLHRLRLALPRGLLGSAWMRRAAALALVLALVVPAAHAQGTRERDYYHVVSEDEARDFAWIRENVDPVGQTALVTPWKGTAFAVLSGVTVHSAFPHSSGGAPIRHADRFLADHARDDAALQKAGITLIYTDGPVENENFTQVRPHVFVRTSP